MYNTVYYILAFIGCYCVYYANALECYSCIGNNPACLQPNKNVTITCKQHNRELEYQLQSLFGEKYVPPTAKGSEQIQCLHYERQYPNNRTELFRGCLSTNYTKEYCEQQKEHQKLKGNFYNLTKCVVCKSDFCNSGFRPEFSTSSAAFLTSLVLVTKQLLM